MGAVFRENLSKTRSLLRRQAEALIKSPKHVRYETFHEYVYKGVYLELLLRIEQFKKDLKSISFLLVMPLKQSVNCNSMKVYLCDLIIYACGHNFNI